ncbi:MAG: diaminopimelate decarboxylase, partial [Desulfobacterales bacterium]|nr:diaminopimelate decarboxylase [Desulfobacterales bacterium]
MSLNPEILTRIAQDHGTPAYVYDLDRVAQQYSRFTQAFSWPRLRVCYAMKANYNPSILKTLNKLGAGIDAVSPGELYMARACGFDMDPIIYTANNITDGEMAEIHGMGVLLNIGSLSRLEKFGQAFPNSRICLRFNPDVVDGGHDHIKTGGSLTKFGILLEDLPRVKALTAKYNLRVVGLHEHTGSGLQDADSIIQAMENIFSIATPENFPHLEFIDFGGGFNVPYGPKDKDFDMAEIGEKISDAYARFCQRYGRPLDLIFEPGKFITAQSGVLLTRVNTIKTNRDRTICGT